MGALLPLPIAGPIVICLVKSPFRWATYSKKPLNQLLIEDQPDSQKKSGSQTPVNQSETEKKSGSQTPLNQSGEENKSGSQTPLNQSNIEEQPDSRRLLHIYGYGQILDSDKSTILYKFRTTRPYTEIYYGSSKGLAAIIDRRQIRETSMTTTTMYIRGQIFQIDISGHHIFASAFTFNSAALQDQLCWKVAQKSLVCMDGQQRPLAKLTRPAVPKNKIGRIEVSKVVGGQQLLDEIVVSGLTLLDGLRKMVL